MKPKLLCITPIRHIIGLEKKLKRHFSCRFVDDPNEKEFIKIEDKYSIIFTNPNKSKIFLNRKNLKSKKNLKIICTASTGTNHIDLDYVKRQKIKIMSLRKDIKIIKKISSTAEHAVALMMSATRNIQESNIDVKKLNWDYTKFIGRQISGLKIGIIGYGRLGKIFTKIISGFNCKILIYEKNFKIKDKFKNNQSTLNNLLKQSDIISIHIHADKTNINFLNKTRLNLLKKDILIINTSRGEIVNENDLLLFLKNNPKSKYAADVLSNETKNIKNNLLIKYSLQNNQILITPHIGGMTDEAQKMAYNHSADKLIKLFAKNNKI